MTETPEGTPAAAGESHPLDVRSQICGAVSPAGDSLCALRPKHELERHGWETEETTPLDIDSIAAVACGNHEGIADAFEIHQRWRVFTEAKRDAWRGVVRTVQMITEQEQAARLKIYRVRFDAVLQSRLHKYCTADPMFFKNTTQAVPNSQIPDEDWHEVTGRETDNPWQQYNQLRKWESEDREFIRNVRLEKLVSEPRWEAVSDSR